MEEEDENHFSSPSEKNVTKRKALLKLELAGSAKKQLDSVAQKLFDMDYNFQVPSKNNKQWKTTDDVLFLEAKNSYDDIIKYFQEDAKVYKFESTKDKIWAFNRDFFKQFEVIEDVPDPTVLTGSLKKKVSVIEVDQTIEQQLESYINPFDTVYRAERFGSDRKKPVQIWFDKLSLLEKLTPREDLEGYEYRESNEERKFRLDVQKDYQNRLKEEIQRREQFPTELEQVEDVLYDIVDTVCRRVESEEQRIRRAEKAKIRQTWHYATLGYKMSHLKVIETEAGEVKKILSDFEFNDIIISLSGHMTAPFVPEWVFEKHEAERKKAKNERHRLRDLLEIERQRPISEKFQRVLTDFTDDPKGFSTKLVSVKKPKLKSIQSRLLLSNTSTKKKKTNQIIVQGLASLLRVTQDPMMFADYVTDQMKIRYNQLFNKEQNVDKLAGINDYIKQLDLDYVKSKNRNARRKSRDRKGLSTPDTGRSRRDSNASINSIEFVNNSKGKMKPTDCVQLKLTLLIDPPPLYVWRPPKTAHKEMKKFSETAMEKLQEMKEKSLAMSTSLLQRIKNRFSHHNNNNNQQQELEHIMSDDEAIGANNIDHDDNNSKVIREDDEHAEQQGEQKNDDQISVISNSVADNRSIEHNEHIDDIVIANDKKNNDDNNQPMTDDDEMEMKQAANENTNANDDRNDISAKVKAVEGQDDIVENNISAVDNTNDNDVNNAINEVDNRSVDSQVKGSIVSKNSKLSSIYSSHLDNDELQRKSRPNTSEAIPENEILHDDVMSRLSMPLPPPTSQQIMPMKPKYKEKVISIKNLMSSKTFNGDIRPKDLVIRPEKGSGERVVFDDSERRAFEAKFISELGTIISLPSSNITLENIRRLEIDSDRLKELKQRSEIMKAQYTKEREEYNKRVAAERAYRKSLMDGTYAKQQEELLELKRSGLLPPNIPSPVTKERQSSEQENLTNGNNKEELTLLPLNEQEVTSNNVETGTENKATEMRLPLVIECSDNDLTMNSHGNNSNNVDGEDVIASEVVVPHTGRSQCSSNHESIISEESRQTISNVKIDVIFKPNDKLANTTTISTDVVDVKVSDVPEDNDCMNGNVIVGDSSVVIGENDMISLESQQQQTNDDIIPPLSLGKLPPAKSVKFNTDANMLKNICVSMDSHENLEIPMMLENNVSYGDLTDLTESNYSGKGRNESSSSSENNDIDNNKTSDNGNDDNNLNPNNDLNGEGNKDFENKSENESQSGNNIIEIVSPSKINPKYLPHISEPAFPEPFQIGIENPQNMKYDPNYWFSRELNELTDEEKRQYRIARLKLLRKENEIQARINLLKQWKEELIEDTIDYFAPLIEQMQPAIDYIRPYAEKANTTLYKKATECFTGLNQLTANYQYNGDKLMKLNGMKEKMDSWSQSMKSIKAAAASAKQEQRRKSKERISSRETSPRRNNSHATTPRSARHSQEVIELMHELVTIIERKNANDETVLLDQQVDSNNDLDKDTLSQNIGTSQLEPMEQHEMKTRSDSKQMNTSEVVKAVVTNETQTPVAVNMVEDTEFAETDEDFTTMINQLKDQAEHLDDDNDNEGEGEDENENEEEDANDDQLAAAAKETNIETDKRRDNDETEQDLIQSAKVNDHENEQENQDQDDEQQQEEERQEDEGEQEEVEEEEEEEEEEPEEVDEEQQEVDEENKSLMSSRHQSIAQIDDFEQKALDELDQVQNTMDQMQTNEEQLDEWEQIRLERLKKYPVEVVEVLDRICLAIELAHMNEFADQLNNNNDDHISRRDELSTAHTNRSSMFSESESIISLKSQYKNIDDKEVEDHRLVGCEITLMVLVTDEQRKIYGLDQIEAEDVAVMLQQQLYDLEAPIYASTFFNELLDVQYKLPYKRRTFEDWESFWAHLIHPVFIGYSTHKPGQPKPRISDGRTETGVMPVNPVNKFTERNKLTFKAINQRSDDVDPNVRVSRNVIDLVPSDKSQQQQQDDENLLDLQVDEFHELDQPGRKLKIFRPNMEKLTAKDILRLKRTHKAFQEQYEEEMSKGLVDNERLRPEQYEALKDRDTAFRIYRTARQKYNRSHGHVDELVLPPLQITKIDHEIFQGWVDEVKAEDHKRMIERRKKAAHMKEILKQEAELRRKALNQKFWVFDKFTSLCEDSLDVANGVQDELYKMELQDELIKGKSVVSAETKRIIDDIVQNRLDFKKLLIAEEKKTRKLFLYVNNWVDRFKNSGKPLPMIKQKTDKSLNVAADNTTASNVPFASTNIPFGSNSNNNNMVDDNTVSSSSDSKSQQQQQQDVKSARSQQSGNSDNNNDIPLEIHDQKSVTSSLKEDDNNTIDSGTLNSPTKSKTKLSGDDDNETTLTLPYLMKEEFYQFIEVAMKCKRDEERAIRRREREKLMEEKRARRQRRKESLQTSKMAASILGQRDKLAAMAAAIEDEKEDDDESSSNDDSQSEDDTTVGTLKSIPLLTEEFGLVKQIKWLQSIFSYPQYFTCLKELPTLQPDRFARDELTQFASIVAESEPMFAKILAEVKKAKEEAEIALGIKKSKQHEKEQHRQMRKKQRDDKKAKKVAHDQEEEAKLHDETYLELLHREAEEKKQREHEKMLEELRKQSEREKAWFMAHPHKFIQQNPNEPAFCIVCKEKEYEYWLKTNKEQEKKWRGHFEKHLTDTVDSMESETRKRIEIERKEEFERKAEEEVTKDMQNEEQAASQSTKSTKSLGVFNPFKINALLKKEGGNINKNDKIKDAQQQQEEDDWPKQLEKIINIIKKAGLSLVDARGKSILPTEPPPKVVIQTTTPTIVVEDNNKDGEYQANLGMKLRLWHRDESGDRANFLGVVNFTEKDLMKPPKGIRTYQLKPDYAIVETTPTKISGSVTIKLIISHNDHKHGYNTHWRLDIKKAQHLATIDEEKLTNPYIEVYWRGPVEKNKQVLDLEEFTLVGQTMLKINTIDPIFKRDEDHTLFELPPVWTDYDIPSRGGNVEDIQYGGGWVARNHIPIQTPIEEQDEVIIETTKSGKQKKFKFGAKSPEEIRKFKEAVKFNEYVQLATQEHLDMLKYLFTAEENERKCMGHEERDMRHYMVQFELTRCQPLIVKQTEYSRTYMRMLQLVKSPPNILSRLRFLMGTESKGGGMKVRCEDPATSLNFIVTSIPILYADDEEYLCKQMNSLIGKNCSNINKVVDFSVHQVRDYNQVGFTSTDERIAIVVLEFNEGFPLLKYINENWETLTNDTFRELLSQIMNGIAALHEEGVMHRNFHPDAVLLEPSSNKKLVKFKSSKSATSLDGNANNTANSRNRKKANYAVSDNFNCRVGDYWFLHNPRKPGCSYSYGRADWGAASTTPPECVNNSKFSTIPVSEKSDIYAFGACVYHWATNGTLTLPKDLHQRNVDSVFINLPIKWGKWLQSLLNMCLQPSPNCRASAKEILIYLQSRYGK